MEKIKLAIVSTLVQVQEFFRNPTDEAAEWVIGTGPELFPDVPELQNSKWSLERRPAEPNSVLVVCTHKGESWCRWSFSTKDSVWQAVYRDNKYLCDKTRSFTGVDIAQENLTKDVLNWLDSDVEWSKREAEILNRAEYQKT